MKLKKFLKKLWRPKVLLPLAILLVAIVAINSFVIPGWSDCTTKTAEYAGLTWEIEGCPLGLANRNEDELAKGLHEFDQNYSIDDKLNVWSRAIGRRASLVQVKITARTVVPEDKDFDINYELRTKDGRASVTVYRGLTKLFEVEKGAFTYSATMDKVDWPDDPNFYLRREYREGKIFCSTVHPLGDKYGRWNTPHCWYANFPITGKETVSLKEGERLEVVLTSHAEIESEGSAEVSIFTTPVLKEELMEEVEEEPVVEEEPEPIVEEEEEVEEFVPSVPVDEDLVVDRELEELSLFQRIINFIKRLFGGS